MGLGGIGPGSLLLILLIVLVLFGGKKLRSLGSDLGAGIKGFKEGMKEEETVDQLAADTSQAPVDAQVQAVAKVDTTSEPDVAKR